MSGEGKGSLSDSFGTGHFPGSINLHPFPHMLPPIQLSPGHPFDPPHACCDPPHPIFDPTLGCFVSRGGMRNRSRGGAPPQPEAFDEESSEEEEEEEESEPDWTSEDNDDDDDDDDDDEEPNLRRGRCTRYSTKSIDLHAPPPCMASWQQAWTGGGCVHRGGCVDLLAGPAPPTAAAAAYTAALWAEDDLSGCSVPNASTELPLGPRKCRSKYPAAAAPEDDEDEDEDEPAAKRRWALLQAEPFGGWSGLFGGFSGTSWLFPPAAVDSKPASFGIPPS